MDKTLNFSVDTKNMDISAYVTLRDDNGMMFHTKEDRADFFDYVGKHPRELSYGAALGHARAVNLGIWGNYESLYTDCVQIMVAEFKRLEIESGKEFGITEDFLMVSKEFREAYVIARSTKEAAINNLVRSLGDNNSKLPKKEVDQSQFSRLEGIHQRIIDELYDRRR